ncbi:NAD(P)/FAD-dependent oxidoreductase [Streptomyces smyrnaeus]|uniref:NAD(P)/FAD-dependent oxidoreductase n=1 Tax=Streptomyces TaxID=1883 RepID=UPI00161ADBA4|nr:FAD-dependent monooxygenase [Streptomyces sp. B15]MBQ1123881.1 FAD-dependent monooxygenase [Streptomyces sp. B15]MBQ1160744.1 FAD-dependent monooxygenase [Streptomyces sp. A73]
MTRPGHGIVVGGSWAGMLAAHVLARHLDSVTVVERDALPDEPRHRRGTPQARHGHILWSEGAGIVEDLLPGTSEELLAAGARKLRFQTDLVTLTSHGWQHRFPPRQFGLMCTRPLLDWTVRRRILAGGRITLRERTEVLELAGDGRRVTGVGIRDIDSGVRETLEADLVVDASGRGSRVRRWLTGLGLPAVEEDVVDVGMAYASRMYRAPEGATELFPAVNVAADHRERKPGRFGVVYPQEDGQWMVTLSCTRGGELPTREEDFLAYTDTLRDPLVKDLISQVEPLTPVSASRLGINRRLYPERLAHWPDGLVVLGDSLAVFNPIYGHGMSAAARGAAALDEQLSRPFGPGAAHRAQRAISAAVDDPWIMAASKDIAFVNCRNSATDPRLTGGATARQTFADLVAGRSIRSPEVSDVVTDVMSMTSPQSTLGSSDFMALLHSDGMRPDLAEPPLSQEEMDLVGLRPRSAVGARGAVAR